MEKLDKEKIRQALNAYKEQLAAIDASEKEIENTFGKTRSGLDMFSRAQKAEAERLAGLRKDFISDIDYPDTPEEVIAALRFLMSLINVSISEYGFILSSGTSVHVHSKREDASGGREGDRWYVRYFDYDACGVIFKKMMNILVKAQKEYALDNQPMRMALLEFVKENDIDNVAIKIQIHEKDKIGDIEHVTCNYEIGSLQKMLKPGDEGYEEVVAGKKSSRRLIIGFIVFFLIILLLWAMA